MMGVTPRRVVVLGGTGYVGRQVCAAFAHEGSDVTVVARRPAEHSGQYRFVPFDVTLRTSRELAELLAAERADVVVNAIAGWEPTEQAMYDANVLPVDRIIEALRSLPSSPRLVHIGTIHEYGPTKHGTSIQEDTEPAPTTTYARLKLLASQGVLDAVRIGDVNGVVVRIANTLGPHPGSETFIGSLAIKLTGPTALADGIELTIADAQRDYVDVRDAADAVVRAAGNPGADPLVNVGSGRALSLRTLVYELTDAAGLPRDSVRERTGEIRSWGGDWTRFDISRARDLLGWRPTFSLAESMKSMLSSLDS